MRGPPGSGRSSSTGAAPVAVPGVRTALPATGLDRARRRGDLVHHRHRPRRGRDCWRELLRAETVGAIGITNQRRPPSRGTPALGSPPPCGGVAGPPHRRPLPTAERAGTCRASDLTGRCSTGLLGVEVRWLLTDGGVAADDDLRLGTVDSWLLWKLTGGSTPLPGGPRHRPVQRKRTMLYDISRSAVVVGAVRAVRGADRSAARGPAVVRRLRLTAADGPSAAASRCRASPGTSRRRCSARRA